MSNSSRSVIAAAVVLLSVLIAAPACQCDSEEPVKKTDHKIVFESEKVDDKIQWKKIDDITVWGGDTIRFTIANHAAWILIPDIRFKLLEGGSDWVVTEAYTAFRVENGYAVIRLDDCHAGAEPVEKIHYSVLVLHDSEQWEYVHGKNPPPGMTVPRKR